MAAASLRDYDGSAGVLVDTNVWVDCIDKASAFHEWAIEQLQACSERSPRHVNVLIYTELLVPDPDVAALDDMLDVYDTLRSPLPWACARLAARAFAAYRRRGSSKQRLALAQHTHHVGHAKRAKARVIDRISHCRQSAKRAGFAPASRPSNPPSSPAPSAPSCWSPESTTRAHAA